MCLIIDLQKKDIFKIHFAASLELFIFELLNVVKLKK